MYPILLFDGDCAFCTASVNFLQRYIRPKARIIAWQRADLATLGVSEQECRESIQWFAAPGSRPLTQGRAVAAALRCGAAPWPLVGRLMQLPGVVQVVDAVYRLVAANRFRLPGATPACRLPDPAVVGEAEGGVAAASGPASSTARGDSAGASAPASSTALVAPSGASAPARPSAPAA